MALTNSIFLIAFIFSLSPSTMVYSTMRAQSPVWSERV
jgi:hypothetical protein